MIGGMRGSGKSNVALNIYTSQYEQGNVGLYFSIEMNKREVFNRTISMLAEVSAAKIRNGNLNDFELSKIAKVRSQMFSNAEEAYHQFLKDNDYKTFEYNLIRNYELKKDNQLIIIDNSRLTLADIDMNIQKFKAQFGDKLKVVVVDYVNQIEIEDIYNWQQQVTLSKQLKKFARKYDVVMITPYQINKEGEARFSKGVLDAADIAMVLTPGTDYIKFDSTKVRHSAPFSIASNMNWDILKIYPQEYIVQEEPIKMAKKKEPERGQEDMPF
jgi:replicative DNA helicase